MKLLSPAPSHYILACVFIVGYFIHVTSCLNMWTSLDEHQASKTPVKRCVSPCKIFHTWCKNDGKCREKGKDCTWYCECPENCEGFFCEKIVTKDSAVLENAAPVSITYEKETKKDITAFDKSKLAQALAGIIKKNQNEEEKRTVVPDTMDRIGNVIETKENVTAKLILNCPPEELAAKAGELEAGKTAENKSDCRCKTTDFSTTSLPTTAAYQVSENKSVIENTASLANNTSTKNATIQEDNWLMDNSTDQNVSLSSVKNVPSVGSLKVTPIVISSTLRTVAVDNNLTAQSTNVLTHIKQQGTASTNVDQETMNAQRHQTETLKPTKESDSINSLFKTKVNEITSESQPSLLQLIEKAIEIDPVATKIPTKYTLNDSIVDVTNGSTTNNTAQALDSVTSFLSETSSQDMINASKQPTTTRRSNSPATTVLIGSSMYSPTVTPELSSTNKPVQATTSAPHVTSLASQKIETTFSASDNTQKVSTQHMSKSVLILNNTSFESTVDRNKVSPTTLPRTNNVTFTTRTTQSTVEHSPSQKRFANVKNNVSDKLATATIEPSTRHSPSSSHATTSKVKLSTNATNDVMTPSLNIARNVSNETLYSVSNGTLKIKSIYQEANRTGKQSVTNLTDQNTISVSGAINSSRSTNKPTLNVTGSSIISHDVPSTSILDTLTKQTAVPALSSTDGRSELLLSEDVSVQNIMSTTISVMQETTENSRVSRTTVQTTYQPRTTMETADRKIITISTTQLNRENNDKIYQIGAVNKTTNTTNHGTEENLTASGEKNIVLPSRTEFTSTTPQQLINPATIQTRKFITKVESPTSHIHLNNSHDFKTVSTQNVSADFQNRSSENFEFLENGTNTTVDTEAPLESSSATSVTVLHDTQSVTFSVVNPMPNLNKTTVTQGFSASEDNSSQSLTATHATHSQTTSSVPLINDKQLHPEYLDNIIDRKPELTSLYTNTNEFLNNRLPDSVKKDLKIDLLKSELPDKGSTNDMDNRL